MIHSGKGLAKFSMNHGLCSMVGNNMQSVLVPVKSDRLQGHGDASAQPRRVQARLLTGQLQGPQPTATSISAAASQAPNGPKTPKQIVKNNAPLNNLHFHRNSQHSANNPRWRVDDAPI